jgi:5'-methylthioadenosine phosphorylase
MTKEIHFAIIGGSGLYEMGGIQDPEEINLDTPFGKTSAPIVTGVLSGHRIAFLARHGLGHHLTPTEVPYLANIYALKSIGVNRILGISACGSLREDYAPGHMVIPDQLYDNTKNRTRTFFGDGLVGHISIANPFCEDLSNHLEKSVKTTGAIFHRGGTLITIEGPRFSTRAESNIYRSWDISLIGMTAAPEAFLAREAEICYAVLAHVTDYDVWRISEEPVTVEMVIKTLNKNTLLAQRVIENLVLNLVPSRSCSCSQALSSALITQRKAIPSTTIKKLEPIIKKYFKNQEL